MEGDGGKRMRREMGTKDVKRVGAKDVEGDRGKG